MAKKRTSGTTEIKIAYIGGGSRYWAHELMADLALCPHITGHLALYDIDQPAAERNVEIGNQIFSQDSAQTRFKVTAAKSPATALKNADFVVLSIEPGITRMRYADLEIPRKYGIMQPVGDTTGPGGIVRALRSVPIKTYYAHKIMEHCPEAWVINYTNPMTLCTAALYAAEPNIKAFGCCHEVFGTQRRFAGHVERWFDVPKPERQEIKLDVAGVNHFTFATSATWDGTDLFRHLEKEIQKRGFFRSRAKEAQQRKKQGKWFGSNGLIAYDLFRRFGAMGAAGDRHLAEFVPWYATDEANLQRWGVVLTPYSWRIKVRSGKPPSAKNFRNITLNPSGEEGVAQMLALLGIEPLDTNVNIPNTGQLVDLPLGAIVETNAQFRKDRLRPIHAKPLPAGANALMRQVVDTQQLTLQAAVERDRDLAFQAMLNDPLVSIPTDKAWKMFNQMVEYTKEMLPGW